MTCSSVHHIYVTNHLTLQANQDESENLPDSGTLQLAPYGNYYQTLGADESLRRTYELLACFKKDMHKVSEKSVMKTWWWWQSCGNGENDICTAGGDLPDGG